MLRICAQVTGSENGSGIANHDCIGAGTQVGANVKEAGGKGRPVDDECTEVGADMHDAAEKGRRADDEVPDVNTPGPSNVGV